MSLHNNLFFLIPVKKEAYFLASFPDENLLKLQIFVLCFFFSQSDKRTMEHDEIHEDYLTWLRIVRKYQAAYGVNEPLLKSSCIQICKILSVCYFYPFISRSRYTKIFCISNIRNRILCRFF